MQEKCSRVVTRIGIHKHRQNGGRERKEEKFGFRGYWQLQVFDGKTIRENCFEIAFSLSMSLVNLQGHWIKGSKFLYTIWRRKWSSLTLRIQESELWMTWVHEDPLKTKRLLWLPLSKISFSSVKNWINLDVNFISKLQIILWENISPEWYGIGLMKGILVCSEYQETRITGSSGGPFNVIFLQKWNIRMYVMQFMQSTEPYFYNYPLFSGEKKKKNQINASVSATKQAVCVYEQYKGRFTPYSFSRHHFLVFDSPHLQSLISVSIKLSFFWFQSPCLAFADVILKLIYKVLYTAFFF